jgi:hypothetical protein
MVCCLSEYLPGGTLLRIPCDSSQDKNCKSSNHKSKALPFETYNLALVLPTVFRWSSRSYSSKNHENAHATQSYSSKNHENAHATETSHVYQYIVT